MKQYDHKKIEKKWQKKWAKEKLYEAKDKSSKKKFYPLVEFPFPSGSGLHTGHVRSYTAMDIVARKHRMQGENVLYPIGWDAFGLPTENYAIKTGLQPKIVTKQNTDNFRRQLKAMGISFDWSREINTTDPEYYRWTQWIFLKMYEKGLAYKTKTEINWCPKDKIGLANEEVVNGKCDRCGTAVEKRVKEQWMLAITQYADRLYKDLDKVDYLEKIKIQQRNWIGRSSGAELEFDIKGVNEKITVFTTRPDTLYGVTYIVLAPEHGLVSKLSYKNKLEVEKYISTAKKMNEIDRTDAKKEKTGIRLEGVYAVNPVNNEEVPVFIADYVLLGYGTGAVMAVPAHDDRDFDFAKKYNLPIKEVVSGGNVSIKAFTEEGNIINSESFNGKKSEEIKKEITDFVNGRWVVKYKLRDWIFSRQRYWGEPIPMIDCDKCGWVPVPEKDLPVTLPMVKKYEPTDTGESPLSAISSWVNVKCPKCKGKARRETDTMPNWAGSSWYYLRYVDPKNKKSLADFKKLSHWTPVDWYNGGMEHTTLHLLYSRFWHKFLFDIGVVPSEEPYLKRTSHGMILAEGGEKMSKSRGNVINPDNLIDTYGADTLRLYEMFMGPFDQAISWDSKNLVGPRRFIERIFSIYQKSTKDKNIVLNKETEILLNKTIKKVSVDIETLGFNTAVSSLMILTNSLEKEIAISRSVLELFIKLLAPFIPHLAEEIWQGLGNKKSIHISNWPIADETKMIEKSVTIMVQVNGKTRASFETTRGTPKEILQKTALELDDTKKWLVGKTPNKIIIVPDRLVSIVVNI